MNCTTLFSFLLNIELLPNKKKYVMYEPQQRTTLLQNINHVMHLPKLSTE